MKPVSSSRGALRSLALSVALGTGCAPTAMMHAAKDGDRAALGRAIAAAETGGHLGIGTAAGLARAVVARELSAREEPAYTLERLHDVRACALDVNDVLAELTRRDDAVGGEAALERVETGALGDGAARDHAASSDDRWRAVGVWGMTRARDREARLQGLRDGSPLVRRSALHAILASDDPADVDAVLEAAQKDPVPLLRSTAVRALARMGTLPDGIANRLRDLWTSADEPLRGDLAYALAAPNVLQRGGQEALTHLLATTKGNEAVSVAAAALSARADDPAFRASAVARLASEITDGGHRARIHAIAVAPLPARGHDAETKTLLEAVRAASRAEDLDVRIGALGRLADTRRGVPWSDRAAAIASLEELAAPSESTSLRGSRARLLLAEAGDRRVQAWLAADLRAKDADARLSAAEALAALERASRAAPLLADDDPSVRTRAACTILLASRWKERER